MIIVPNNVKCSFCQKTYCCQSCCSKHEQKIHVEELLAKKEAEHIQDICYLCQRQTFPFGTDLPFLTDEMLVHVSEEHLPLKCGLCSIVYNNLDDLKNVNKCCPTNSSTNHIEESDKVLSPLNKVNMRWSRKSKDGGLQASQEDKAQRLTSTPMQNNFLMTKTLNDSSFNSINCESTSSESDGFSPLLGSALTVVPPTVPKPLKRLSTKSVKRFSLKSNRLHCKVKRENFELSQLVN